jgi:hypothetical protein
MEKTDDLWISEWGEAHACDHCGTEFASGLRIARDPNKHPSRTPGVAYLCATCRRGLDTDDVEVLATLTRCLDTRVTPHERTFAVVTAVDRQLERLTVRLASRTIGDVPYLHEACANVEVGDTVELSAKARTYPEEGDRPFRDDEWIALWPLPAPPDIVHP